MIRKVMLCLLLLFAFAFPVSAQDTEPTGADAQILPLDEPTENPVTEPAPPDQGILEAALALLIKAVADITYVLPAAGFVIAATAITKKLLPATISAGAIALAWQAAAWVAWVLALHFGYASQFVSAIDVLTTVLTAVGGLFLSSLAATKGYNKAVEKRIPLFGYERGSVAAG